MSLLDGFKAFDFSEGFPYVSVTRNGVTFNKAVVVKLNYPSHVLLLINDETHQIAVQACSADNPKAVAFFKPKKSGLISVRWNGKDLMNTLSEMTVHFSKKKTQCYLTLKKQKKFRCFKEYFLYSLLHKKRVLHKARLT